MQLDAAQIKTLNEYFNRHWESARCEVCNATTWSASDRIFEVREYHHGSLVVGSGAVFPFVSISCARCGNAKFISAIGIGLVSPDAPPQGASNG